MILKAKWMCTIMTHLDEVSSPKIHGFVVVIKRNKFGFILINSNSALFQYPHGHLCLEFK